MIIVQSVKVKRCDNPGCNNGNYPKVEIVASGRKFKGYTCACESGCSGTWRLPDVGQMFLSREDLLEYMET